MTHSQAKKHAEENYDPYTADMSWDGQLQDKMLRVIVDEGHEIRHIPKQVGTAIQWLRAHYRDVVTGSPTLNGLEEFSGIMAFMQNPDLESWDFLEALSFTGLPTKDPLDEVLSEFDPWSVNDNDPRGQLKVWYHFDYSSPLLSRSSRLVVPAFVVQICPA